MAKKKETDIKDTAPDTQPVEENNGVLSETQQSGFAGERRSDEASESAPTGACEGCEVRDAATAQLLAAAEDKYLRLAAEYDNYRKRTAKEKEAAWAEAKAQTVAAFLSVYDNLERALKQATADEAYAKGVELTMKGLRDVLAHLGVEPIPALGELFDPNRHNAVMHVEDDTVEENTIVEVFQQGFVSGDKVIRFAMVKVAN